MPQLSPNEPFPIVRVLTDHTDTSTNYVQAIIRDATTDAVLATVNLDDKGNRRFQKVWQVPYDNVYAKGRFVLITTTIYTDSGYTTKNANYSEEGVTYLVQQRWNQNIYTSAGGGVAVDYAAMRKLFKEEIAAMPANELEPLELPEPIDHTPQINELKGAIAALAAKVDAIKIPEPEKPEPVDFAPLERQLTTVLRAISALPKFKELDLNPLARSFTSLIQSLLAEVRSLNDTLLQEIRQVQVEQVKPKTFTFSSSAEDHRNAARTAHLKGLAHKYKI